MRQTKNSGGLYVPSRGGDIEKMQLKRLASTMLAQAPTDLAALAENNPQIVWEWIEAFRRQKLAAETEAHAWSEAMAALLKARPQPTRTAAE